MVFTCALMMSFSFLFFVFSLIWFSRSCEGYVLCFLKDCFLNKICWPFKKENYEI